MRNIQCVPPDPKIIYMLFREYRELKKYEEMTFREYLEQKGYTNPAGNIEGMDDDSSITRRRIGPRRISIPSRPITGDLPMKVLLIDFDDRPGSLNKEHYEELLFSKGVHSTGSLYDYYYEVSLHKVKIQGSVDGWLRMPQNYSYYVDNKSGSGSYPKNAQRMAEDAVKTAITQGVEFTSELDILGFGSITALFIIHAGRGAEVMPPNLRGSEIWSHKWVVRNPVNIPSANIAAITYLTVPHNCRLGVCAHELGHLAFQWQDFYDPNYDQDGQWWDGSGDWDLMASGSYNGNGVTPAHPMGLHKMQHRWIDVVMIEGETPRRTLTLPPYTTESGKLIRIRGFNYQASQYLILENRNRKGFDFTLPGEGLLVWLVDERADMNDPDTPGLLLVQADGYHNLENPYDYNQGDAGDPFPGMTNQVNLTDSGNISTSFPNQGRSGVFLSNIQRDPTTGDIKLDLEIKRPS
ncbi:MAG: M6 family metalloprotease domain-containing protein [Candidatus Hermodarchaeota archaeon]